MNKRKVCIVTGTRAEYGLFYPIMQKIKSSDRLILQLVATTMHFSEEFGLTYQEIEKDGFIIDEKVENLLASNSKTSMAKATGLATILLSDVFYRLQPDIVLLLGDRFETHAAATTAMLMNIPIAHIHGGETTEGVIDEQIRHAITKMSQIHFTSTESYRTRIIQMGENPQKVFCTGAPGLDNIMNLKLLSKKSLEEALKWKIKSHTALFTYHPETLHVDNTEANIIDILDQIQQSNINVLFTYANADDSGSIINRKIEDFCTRDSQKYHVVKNLGQQRYLSAMKHVNFMIGNTSSGIIEAASFNIPVINIGNRQKGRLRNANVMDCNIESIGNTIEKLIKIDYKIQCDNVSNIYGDGYASEKIVKYLEELPFTIEKRFYDL